MKKAANPGAATQQAGLSSRWRHHYDSRTRGDIALSILRRVIDQRAGELPPAIAEAVLRLRFLDEDQARMEELASKSNQGMLTGDEAEEYDGYIAAADLLSLWKSKARLALKHHPSAA